MAPNKRRGWLCRLLLALLLQEQDREQYHLLARAQVLLADVSQMYYDLTFPCTQPALHPAWQLERLNVTPDLSGSQLPPCIQAAASGGFKYLMFLAANGTRVTDAYSTAYSTCYGLVDNWSVQPSGAQAAPEVAVPCATTATAPQVDDTGCGPGQIDMNLCGWAPVITGEGHREAGCRLAGPQVVCGCGVGYKMRSVPFTTAHAPNANHTG